MGYIVETRKYLTGQEEQVEYCFGGRSWPEVREEANEKVQSARLLQDEYGQYVVTQFKLTTGPSKPGTTRRKVRPYGQKRTEEGLTIVEPETVRDPKDWTDEEYEHFQRTGECPDT
jgi:hypothetical protein